MKRIDLTNKKFGQLTVFSFSHSHVLPSGQKRAMWNVVCDCGTYNIISSSNLKVTTSCGCLKKEGLNKKPKGVASFNSKLNSYKHWAKKRNLSWELTKDDFLSIVAQPCHYCGIKNATTYQANNCNGSFTSNGIDRKDSSKGYELKNCLPCCSRCNVMKMDLPYDDFIQHIKRILEHLRKV